MNSMYEELDYQETPLGELILRRRRANTLEGAEIYEVLLDGEFLMSSVVNVSEIALTTLALEPLEGEDLDVLVGGLGLGYTAAAAAESEKVRSVDVIEFLPAVLRWHRKGLIPLGRPLSCDRRCEFHQGDFFAMVAAGELPKDRYDALLIDIDHSPQYLLTEANASFYTVEGLRAAAAYLKPTGVLAIWSADPPEAELVERLRKVFADVAAEEINFDNPLVGEMDSNTIYLGRQTDAP